MISALTLLGLLLPVTMAGMYSQPVINLDAKTFKQALSVEHAAMVAFVAPWCGHCKSLGPEFSAAASSLSPLIPFYAVDCDDASNKRLCGEYNIQGFPTIKAFPRALKGAARDYQGERKRGALVEYAKTLVPDRVRKLRVDDGATEALTKFLGEKSNLPHALLIHPSTPSIPFLWKVLGHRLSSRMHLGYVKDSAAHDMLTSLGIYDPEDTSRDSTRAVFWAAGASRGALVEYDGAFKFNALLEWYQSLLDGQTPPPSPKDDTKHKPVHADTPPSSSSSADAAKQSELERKAKLRAKMEEAERRDQARRERQAAKSASAAAAASTGDSGAAGTEEEGASKVEDAPKPQAEEGVDQEMLDGISPAVGVVGDAQPEQEREEGAGVEVKETMVHEEL